MKNEKELNLIGKVLYYFTQARSLAIQWDAGNDSTYVTTLCCDKKYDNDFIGEFGNIFGSVADELTDVNQATKMYPIILEIKDKLEPYISYKDLQDLHDYFTSIHLSYLNEHCNTSYLDLKFDEKNETFEDDYATKFIIVMGFISDYLCEVVIDVLDLPNATDGYYQVGCGKFEVYKNDNDQYELYLIYSIKHANMSEIVHSVVNLIDNIIKCYSDEILSIVEPEISLIKTDYFPYNLIINFSNNSVRLESSVGYYDRTIENIGRLKELFQMFGDTYLVIHYENNAIDKLIDSLDLPEDVKEKLHSKYKNNFGSSLNNYYLYDTDFSRSEIVIDESSYLHYKITINHKDNKLYIEDVEAMGYEIEVYGYEKSECQLF